MRFVFCFMQTNRLNVVRNDGESWDYTNPNLGKYFVMYIKKKQQKIKIIFNMQLVFLNVI